MYKKTVTFTDYNGNQRTKDCYFNLNKVECTQLQVSTKEAFDEHIKKIVESEDKEAIFDIFNKIILKAYGEKSEDGLRFVKSDKISEEFSQTEAYVEVFMDIATNPTSAEEFIKGTFPSDFVKQIPQSK